MRAILTLLFLAAATPASAQRPTAFYILTPSTPPPAELAQLPDGARETYARIGRLRSARSAAGESLPEGPTRRARLLRLSEDLDAAWSELQRALERSRARLDARGWLLLGQTRIEAADRAYLAALEAHDGDPEHAEPPAAGDRTAAIDALRMASALASEPELGAWARYLEALSLIEMARRTEASVALRLVAASGPRALRGEARLRLGAIATEQGEPDLAAAWFERALPDVRPELTAIAVYELAWAYYRANRHQAMRAAIARLPTDASPGLREELAHLEQIAAMP